MTGEDIRKRREALGMNQTELAEKIGMPGGQTYVSAVERGTITPKHQTLERIAAALGLQLIITLSDPVLAGCE